MFFMHVDVYACIDVYIYTCGLYEYDMHIAVCMNMLGVFLLDEKEFRTSLKRLAADIIIGIAFGRIVLVSC